MTEDQTPPMSRPRVAAGALFFDEQGRVLLVKPTYKNGWDIPGGYVEPGETPSEACLREVREELSLCVELGRLLVADWAPSDKEGDKVLFVFDGGRLSADELRRIALPPEELGAAAFHAVHEISGLMPARLSRRITAAVQAREDATFNYLERGRRAGGLGCQRPTSDCAGGAE